MQLCSKIVPKFFNSNNIPFPDKNNREPPQKQLPDMGLFGFVSFLFGIGLLVNIRITTRTLAINMFKKIILDGMAQRIKNKINALSL